MISFDQSSTVGPEPIVNSGLPFHFRCCDRKVLLPQRSQIRELALGSSENQRRAPGLLTSRRRSSVLGASRSRRAACEFLCNHLQIAPTSRKFWTPRSVRPRYRVGMSFGRPKKVFTEAELYEYAVGALGRRMRT